MNKASLPLSRSRFLFLYAFFFSEQRKDTHRVCPATLVREMFARDAITGKNSVLEKKQL